MWYPSVTVELCQMSNSLSMYRIMCWCVNIPTSWWHAVCTVSLPSTGNLESIPGCLQHNWTSWRFKAQKLRRQKSILTTLCCAFGGIAGENDTATIMYLSRAFRRYIALYVTSSLGYVFRCKQWSSAPQIMCYSEYSTIFLFKTGNVN